MSRLRSRIASIALRTYMYSPHTRRGNLVVSGYPKSGTTWVTQLAAHLAGLDYRQGDVRFRSRRVALHTHGTAFAGQGGILHAVRDPRETVCSAARAMQAQGRPRVFDAGGRVFDDFVGFAITALPGSRKSLRGHLQAGIDGDWPFVRFEDLKHDPHATLAELVDSFGWRAGPEDISAAIAAFDFGRQKARNEGNAFFARSAIASWTRLLSPGALDMLEEEVGEEARAFGYDLSQLSGKT